MLLLSTGLIIGLLIGFVACWRWRGYRDKFVKAQPMTIRVAVRDPDIEAALRGDA